MIESSPIPWVHKCGDPECSRPHLTEKLLERISQQSDAVSIEDALSVPLLGPVSLNAVEGEYTKQVAKQSKVVDEMAKIRTIEDKLFRSLLSAYLEKANAAIRVAVSSFPKGEGKAKRSDVLKALRRADVTFFRGWAPKRLDKLLEDSVEEIYKLAQQAVLRKAVGAKGYEGASLIYKAIATAQVKPSFNLADEAAVAYLKSSQKFWVAAPGLWTAADDLIKVQGLSIIEGMTYDQAGEALEAALVSAKGTTKSLAKSAAYWEGVAANAATTARTSGAIREMQQIGVTTYTISNPLDRRTTKICRYMNGKTMSVSSAVTMLDELELKGTTAGNVKKIHPWHPRDYPARFAKLGIDVNSPANFPLASSDKIAKAGFALPPYHFRCRSTVDVSDDIDFTSLGTVVTSPGVAKVPPLAKTPKPAPIPAATVPKTPKPEPMPVAAKPPKPKAAPSVVEEGMFETSDGKILDVTEMRLNPGRREGGMHTKCFFTDEDGATWMFKPYSHRTYDGVNQGFRAFGDKMAADTARALGVPTAEVQVVQIPKGHPALREMGINRGPVTGSIQKFADGIQGELGHVALDALDEAVIHQLQREHVFDFLISNYDSHGANLLRTRQGLLGIDKGQVFRYFGKDSLDIGFNPNMADYGVKTYYNQQFPKYARGSFGKDFALKADNAPTMKFIDAVEKMPDDQFVALFKPYFSAAEEAGIRWNGLNANQALSKLLERKKGLRKAYTSFYDDLEKQRRKALGIKPPKKEVAAYKPVNATWMKDLKSGNAKGVSYFTPANGQIRSGEILFKTADGDGVIGSLQLHPRGYKAFKETVADKIEGPTRATGERRIKASIDELNDQLSTETTKIAKSLNAHLVDESHPVFDGSIPAHTFDNLKKTWKKAEDILYEALPGSADEEIAKHYIKWFQKVTKSERSGDFFGTSQIKEGIKTAGKINPARITKTSSAQLERGNNVKQATSAKKDKFEYKVQETSMGKSFPNQHLSGSVGNPRMRWDGETYRVSTLPGVSDASEIVFAKGYEVTFTNTRNPIRVIIANPDSAKRTFQGRVRIYIDKAGDKLTKADMDEALEAVGKLGIDTRAATAKDIEARYILKTTDQAYPNAARGGRHWDKSMPKLSSSEGVWDPDEVIEKWGAWWAKKLDAGDSIDDLRKLKSYDPNVVRYTGGKRLGNARWERFDFDDSDLAALQDHAPHICLSNSAYSTIKMILENGTDQFMSNNYKLRYNIPMGGQSPMSDVRRGGANRVFTGVFRSNSEDIRNSSYFQDRKSFVRFNSRLLRDADAVYFDHDNFGEVTDMAASSVQRTARGIQTASGESGNEFLFRQSLSLEELDYVPVSTQAQKAELVNLFAEAGLKPTNGKRWSQIVRVDDEARSIQDVAKAAEVPHGV